MKFIHKLFRIAALAALPLFLHLAAAAQAASPILSVEDMRADVDMLRNIIEQTHPNPYRASNKELIEKHWRAAGKEISAPLPANEFHNIVSRLVNQYNDGHTFIDMPWETEYFKEYEKAGGTFFPYKVSLIGGRLVIAESWGERKLPAGTEIRSLNGKNSTELLRETRPLAGGDSAEGRDNNLTRLFSLILWEKYQSGKFVLKVRRPGSHKDESIDAAGVSYDTLSKIMFGEKAVYAYELTPEILVLEVNKMQSRDEVKKYIDETFVQIREKNYPYLVIDLRKNSGGDSTVGGWVLDYLTRKAVDQGGTKEVRLSPYMLENNKFFQSWAPKLKAKYPVEGDRVVMRPTGEDEKVDNDKWIYPGKTIMLTSPRTYSSGFMMAEAFNCYKVGPIVGEAPGSFRNLTGELMQFRLPKSKLIGYVSTAQYFPPCYQKVRTDFLKPDVALHQTVEDLAAGRDTVLEYVKKLAAAK